MIKKSMYLRSELLERVDVEEATLSRWEKLGLFKPVGKTKDQLYFYSQDTLDRIRYIQSLVELGYQPQHVLKIMKKIGLPKGDPPQEKPEKLNRYLTVGDLAERAGLSPRTLKHWEDKGIIEPDMRSQGGFRLYSEDYVYVCQLIKDLQLFGYTLEEIKTISDLFREFLAISQDIKASPPGETRKRLEAMTRALDDLHAKIDLFKTGIERWETLLKKKRKELASLKSLNTKRQEKKKEVPSHA